MKQSATVGISQIANVVRSKNAGPYIVTFDIFCKTSRIFERLRDSNKLSVASIAGLFSIPESDVLNVIFFEPAWAVKINIRRSVPAGNVGDTDVYGAQQHAPLLTLRFPAEWLDAKGGEKS